MDLLAPFGLALGALSAPLIAMYFLRVRRRRVKVSSLLAWHALQQNDKLASPFQRFQRHLLLALQLAMLAALTLAAARPYLRTEAAPWRSVVLVVDTSASMGATDGNPTRMADAITRGSDILAQLGPTDEAMLVVAGPRTEVLVPFTRDEARVREVLGGLRATEAEGGLREGLQLALSLAKTRSDTEVVVLSDGGSRALSDVPDTSTARVRFERVGTSDRNAGIVALDLRRSPVRDLERQLFVTVQHFGPQPERASVEVTLDGQLVGLRTETLRPDDPVGLVFALAGTAEGTLKVRLDTPGDVLPADDVAWAVLEPSSPRKVLLVGGDALTARALLADPGASVHRVSPAEVTPELLSRYDAAIFAGATPDHLDGLDYAVLGPAHGGPARFGEVVPLPSIVETRRTHPLLRYVSLDGITIAAARAVVDAGGLVPVVQGDTGPLILAGERHGGRVLQLAFDPLDSDLPLRVAWPVLLMNAVGWLTEDDTPDTGQAIRRMPTGVPFVRTTAATSARVTGPRGPLPATVEDGVLRVPALDDVGVYTVHHGAITERFAANLLSEAESRVAPRSDLGLDGRAVVRQAGVAVGRRELWRPLLGFAMVLLVIEWLAWSWRRSA